MKKLSKFIYFIFAFAIIACMAVFNPAIDFASAEEADTRSKTISISNSSLTDTVEAGEDLIIPMPTFSGATGSAKKYVAVTDRSGTQYFFNCDTRATVDKDDNVITVMDGETEVPVKYFTMLDASGNAIAENDTATPVSALKVNKLGKGTYTVQYKVKDGNKTYYSEAKQVQVKSIAYSWEFNAENTAKNIIPSVTKVGFEHILPLPKINNSLNEDEPILYTKADIASGKIKVTNSGRDVTASVLKAGVGEDNNIYFTPTLEDSETSDTYIIKYVSKVSAFPDKTFTVKVERDYETKAELEVTHNAITNYQVGAPTTFPTANVTDKTHNKSSVEVNNVITIKKGGEVYATLNANQYVYTFTEYGTYTIQYSVTDAFGNTATSKTTSITVNDKKPYYITFADTYDISGDNWEDDVITDAEYLIPSEVGYGGFELPAVYAKDYVDDYADLTFTRKLVATDGSGLTFDIDKASDNAALTEDNTNWNERVTFKFPSTNGKVPSDYANMSFELVYSVRDKNTSNTERTATKYTIKIADVDYLTNNIDKNLVINFPTINDVINPNAELEFSSATAKEEPADKNMVADARVQVRTFYYYGAKSDIKTALNTYITKVSAGKADYIEKYGYDFDTFLAQLKDSNNATGEVVDIAINELTMADGKTSIKLGSDYTSQEKVTIFAVAINDQGQFVIEAQEVAINNVDDDGCPTIVGTPESIYTKNNVATGITAFNQNYVVELPKVTFTDTIDKSLQVDVRCYVDTPEQTVGVSIDEFVRTATGECGIEVSEITTTYAGTYYVVYTATDDAGNTATYVSTFEVAKTEKAYIKVENGSNLSKTVGDEVKLNIHLAGNGDYTNEDIKVTWGDNKPSGLGSLPNSYKFDKAGTYVATITAKYTMNGVDYGYTDTPSVTVTITVTEPKMEWASDVNEILANRTANKNEPIELPIISAIENGVEINATPKVTFVGSDDKEEEVEITFDQTTFNNYYFVAEKNGVYTVTYTATTSYNSESKSFTITCGDYYEPTIAYNNNKLEGSTITYNNEDITFTAEFKKQVNEEDEDADMTGKYILTVKAVDVNNKELLNYDINVDLKDTDDMEVTKYFTPDSWSFELKGDSVSSKTTSGNTSKWTIKGVGNYELKLTVKDDNGNSKTETISFKVSSKTEPKSIKDSVVGIVLIVVSAVVLGGVILFFALAGKRNKTKRTSIKSKKD